MTANCKSAEELVNDRIDKILTQYRESPKLLSLIKNYLGQAASVAVSICSIPSFFDLDNAVGDQLTLLGKRLGWPRCHCVCAPQAVFGFECEGVFSYTTLVGFCDSLSNWEDCGPFGSSDICLDDDEVYRTFLKVRRYQYLSMYDKQSLTKCVRLFWGEQAQVLDDGRRRVVVAPNRLLDTSEKMLLQLYARVLPVAPGIKIRYHFGDEGAVFGFGEGWGGFCEEWEPDGLPLITETGEILVTENGDPIMTGPLTRDASWMCEIDASPYDCA